MFGCSGAWQRRRRALTSFGTRSPIRRRWSCIRGWVPGGWRLGWRSTVRHSTSGIPRTVRQKRCTSRRWPSTRCPRRPAHSAVGAENGSDRRCCRGCTSGPQLLTRALSTPNTPALIFVEVLLAPTLAWTSATPCKHAPRSERHSAANAAQQAQHGGDASAAQHANRSGSCCSVRRACTKSSCLSSVWLALNANMPASTAIACASEWADAL
jgi:hypothetical protein